MIGCSCARSKAGLLVLHSHQQLKKQRRNRRRKWCRSCWGSNAGDVVFSFTRDIDFLVNVVTKAGNAPALVSAAALALGSFAYSRETLKKQSAGRRQDQANGKDEDDGYYWTLTLKPTPFNKFVIARCPSIRMDPYMEVDEQVYPKLNLGSHHVVAISNNPELAPSESLSRLEYQRRCIQAEDGGALSLDWPVNLDIEGDHGLDTTLLLIPGTLKGSQEEYVKLFVEKSLQSGYFPVVLNPRGCANAPLTTPRMYSAADSDDVRAAAVFVGSSRPWTTVIAVAWGYGANMLAKYLAETPNSTPLTAAVCVNNPFDLNESTKYTRQNHHGELDHDLLDGFVQILRQHKTLFQGHKQKFDVTGGLTATSVREFEGAISCFSHGYKSLESFYASASSRGVIDCIKVPLLCIQDSSAAPPFCIPQDLFEENPFTTLLYTSREPSDLSNLSIINLALEWFAAVEVAYLKGRHPVLQGVDFTIKPSKGWSEQPGKVLLGEKRLIQEGEYIVVEPREDYWAPQEGYDKQNADAAAHQEVQQESSEDTSSDERQVQQITQFVFNALDVVMPGTLTNDVKKQALEAVGKGETLIGALQNAVPEDVREKLATAVSAAVEARGLSPKAVGFGKNFPPPKLPAGLTESFREKLASITKSRGITSVIGGLQQQNSENKVTEDISKNNSKAGTEVQGSDQVTTDSKLDAQLGEQVVEKRESCETEAGSKDEIAVESSASDEVAQGSEEGSEKSDKQEKAGGQPSSDSADGALQGGHNPDSTKLAGDGTGRAATPMDMRQALETLTGLDDSTQMAVNNVFGVLEEILEKIEREQMQPCVKEQANVKSSERSPEVSEEAGDEASEHKPG